MNTPLGDELFHQLDTSNKLYLAGYSAGYAAGIKYALAEAGRMVDRTFGKLQADMKADADGG